MQNVGVHEAAVALDQPAKGKIEVAFSALRFPPESGAAVLQFSQPGDRAARGG